MSGLGLKEKHGLRKFNEDSLRLYAENPLFRVIRENNETAFDCPLRRLQNEVDPYSLYAFIEYEKNEALQEQGISIR